MDTTVEITAQWSLAEVMFVQPGAERRTVPWHCSLAVVTEMFYGVAGFDFSHYVVFFYLWGVHVAGRCGGCTGQT